MEWKDFYNQHLLNLSQNYWKSMPHMHYDTTLWILTCKVAWYVWLNVPTEDFQSFFLFFSFQVASLPTVNHNVLPPYQTSSSPKSTSSPSALQLHTNPTGSNPQDCIDYSSANDQKTVLGLSSTSSSSHGPSGSLPPGSGSVGGLPPPGTPQGNSGGVPWKYQSFQVL